MAADRSEQRMDPDAVERIVAVALGGLACWP